MRRITILRGLISAGLIWLVIQAMMPLNAESNAAKTKNPRRTPGSSTERSESQLGAQMNAIRLRGIAERFFGCRKFFRAADPGSAKGFEACCAEYLDPELPAPVKGDYALWLIQHPEVTSASPCPKPIEASILNWIGKEHGVLCTVLQDQEQKEGGYLAFMAHRDGIKLSKIGRIPNEGDN